MGSGAISGIAAGVQSASDEDLRAVLAGLTPEAAKKLKEALAAPQKRALIVCTSAGKMGDHDTGLWSEEACGPYYVFKDAGWSVTICSVGGGDIPVDAASLGDGFITENDKRMQKDDGSLFKGTPKLADQAAEAFDVVFFSGGHGTCVDFPTDEVGGVVSKALGAGKVVAAVCHGSMALVNAKTGEGEPVVKGKTVSAFTDEEEEQVKLTEKVPFLLAKKLAELGATLDTVGAWGVKTTRDGNLITGQNPQSSVECAKLCLGA